MLLIFPQLLTYEFFVPLFLRIVLASFFIVVSFNRLTPKNKPNSTKKAQKFSKQLAPFIIWYIGMIEATIGILLIIGFITQIAALLGAVYAVKMILLRETGSVFRSLVEYDLFTYIFLFVLSISILVLGSGPLAFDLPL